MWVNKHAPSQSNHIVGGSQTAVILSNWVRTWTRDQPKKAALLSGQPGVGKTLTVSLVLKELGCDIIELNASDVRNKQTLNNTVRESTKTGMLAFVVKKYKPPLKRVLVMDEIDGMSTGDMGGLAEVISIIKDSEIPIICMCNDRQKVTSIVKYCLDLKVQRPMKPSIIKRLQNILDLENVPSNCYTSSMLMDLIESTGNDIRQCINTRQFWWGTASQLNDKVSISGRDHSPDTIFDACAIIFKGDSKSLDERFDAFFTDYSLMPLFIQQNYIDMFKRSEFAGRESDDKIMEKCSDIADIISDMDQINVSLNWDLLPCTASMCIEVGAKCSAFGGFAQFPKWLGKTSTRNKNSRNMTTVAAHSNAALTTTSDMLRLDYIQYLHYIIMRLIVDENTSEAISTLLACGFSRNDLFDRVKDVLITTKEEEDELDISVSTKIKSAFTREYNKTIKSGQVFQNLYDEVDEPYKQVVRKATKAKTTKAKTTKAKTVKPKVEKEKTVKPKTTKLKSTIKPKK
jgi:replication factor C subunit 1